MLADGSALLGDIWLAERDVLAAGKAYERVAAWGDRAAAARGFVDVVGQECPSFGTTYVDEVLRSSPDDYPVVRSLALQITDDATARDRLLETALGIVVGLLADAAPEDRPALILERATILGDLGRHVDGFHVLAAVPDDDMDDMSRARLAELALRADRPTAEVTALAVRGGADGVLRQLAQVAASDTERTALLQHALAIVERRANDAPSTPVAVARAQILGLLGRYGDALAVLQHVPTDQHDAWSRMEQAWVASNAGRPADEVVQLAQASIAIQQVGDDNAFIHALLADALLRTGMVADAADEIAVALALDADDPMTTAVRDAVEAATGTRVDPAPTTTKAPFDARRAAFRARFCSTAAAALAGSAAAKVTPATSSPRTSVAAVALLSLVYVRLLFHRSARSRAAT